MHYSVRHWNCKMFACLTDSSVWSHHICTDDALVSSSSYPNTCNFTAGKKRDCKKENITLNDRHYININTLYSNNFLFIVPNMKMTWPMHHRYKYGGFKQNCRSNKQTFYNFSDALNTCKSLKHDKTTHVLTDLTSSTTRGGIYIYYNA
jgi:hypothetical protein